MHPEENDKCATTAQLCFCVDTELSLSVEPQSLHWWSHLSFVKHKATMVDCKKTTTKKGIYFTQTQHEAQERPMKARRTMLFYLHNDSEHLPLNLHLVQYQPQMTHKFCPDLPLNLFYKDLHRTAAAASASASHLCGQRSKTTQRAGERTGAHVTKIERPLQVFI